jgi:4-amino-4-deoxy-L-arabinose transferase-like glycosyltransferase
LIGRPAHLLAGAIIGIALVRAVVAYNTALTDDEAYYRLWALAPALSYYDHPPMTAWMIAAGRSIIGDNPLGIRLAVALTSLIGPFVLWRTAAILFDRSIAERATWLALGMPLLAVGGVIITPDTPSVLFWGLAAWSLAELHTSRNANWWLAVGLFSGLGLLSKYTNLFVGAGIVLWIALLPANWRWLRCWQLWVGGVLALSLALPVVLWNADHEWASFTKQFGRVVPKEAATLRFELEFAGAYLGLASPIIAILAARGLWITLRTAIADRSQSHTLLAASIVPLLSYLLLHAVHERVQPNWAAPLYPALAICAAIALAQGADARRRQRVGRAAFIVGIVPCALIYLHAVNPLAYGSSIDDPTSQLRGWERFAAEVEHLRQSNGARWVATSSYATTGQLAFQFKGGPQVVQLTERLRYGHLPPVADSLLRSPAIYVELERRQALAMLRERFSSVTLLGRLARSYRGTKLATYVVYLVADPKGPVLQP